MPFDANLVLRNGLVDLDSGESNATSLTRNDDGSVAIDLGTTTRLRGNSEGAIHVVASLVLPSAPSTFQVNTVLTIEQSDNLEFGWETLATFPTLYSFTRMIRATVTTTFVAADIGGTLTGQSTSDTGTLRWMHPDMLTVGKTGYMIVNMDAAGDVFDNATEEVQGGTTGIADMVEVGFVENSPRLGGPNTFHRAFDVYKRYLRGNWTVSGGNFGKAHLLLSPYPFRTL